MTPERQAFLVNIVAGNATVHARSMTGPHGESLQAAADAIRELSTALASAKDEELAANVAVLRAEADRMGEAFPLRVARGALLRCVDAIESNRHREKV